MFLYQNIWMVDWVNDIKSLGSMTAPDGTKMAPQVSGSLFFTKAWVEID